MTKPRFLALIAVLVMAVAVSSAASSESRLVGKWVEVNGTDRIEFTNAGGFSGTVTYGANNNQRAITGKYFVDEDDISITLNHDSPMHWKFKFSGYDLIVTYIQGGAVKVDGSMAKFHKQ